MEQNSKHSKISPIAVIYACTNAKTGKDSPAAQLLNVDKDIPFSPLVVAAACVSLYDCFERHVVESDQNSFELYFKMMFDELFKSRAEYMNFIDLPVDLPNDDL